jgi:Mg2+/Co2+ transporter CorB
MLSWHALSVLLLVLILLSAFFSASEAALIALNKIRLRHLIEKKRRGARRVYGLVSRMDKLIATVLIGNNLVNAAVAAIVAYLFTQVFGAEKGIVIATVATTLVLVIFGELTPKVFATNHPEGVSFWTRHLVSFFIFIFGPIAHLLTLISNGFIRLLGGNPHYRSPLVTEEEIKMMIQIGKEQGFYGDNERKMLERIFHFDEIEVRDVMTPADEMVAVPVDISEAELEKILMEEGHNRIPVYEQNRDHMIGVLYVRDLLYLFKNSSLINLRDLMSVPFFVSPFQKVAELLKEFQKRKIQIAIVKDPKTQETLGLVTLEDLIEEIVGEIEEMDISR